MQLRPQITFRNMPPSDAIAAEIQEQTAKLEQYCDRIMSCRVVVDAPHRHHSKGNIYQIQIDLTVPGAELVVDRNPDERQAHEDMYVTIRDAFKAATRELQTYTQRRRHEVKHHEPPIPYPTA